MPILKKEEMYIPAQTFDVCFILLKNVANIYSVEGEKQEMKQDNTRRKLIDGTIYVIARDGLDKATTKSIGEATSINQVYIYRHFEDKEDMFAETFASLDDELVDKAMKHVPVMYVREMEYEKRCWVFFSSVWKFILGNRDKCLTFIRY